MASTFFVLLVTSFLISVCCGVNYTSDLLHNIRQAWIRLDRYCTLKFIFFGKSDLSYADFELDWKLVTSFGEPYESNLFISSTSSTVLFNTNNACSETFLKYKSHCKSITVILPPTNNFNNYKYYFDKVDKFGNRKLDLYTLLIQTKSSTGLEKAVEQSSLINLVKFKYIMVYDMKHESGNKIMYLVEPHIYTGKFAWVADSNTMISSLKNKQVGNLSGRNFKVAMVYIPPYSVATPGKSGGFVYSGSHYEFFKEMANRSNFTSEIFFNPRDGTGTKLENGSWNGIMSKVVTGTVDIALAVGVTQSRYEVLDFVQETARETMVFSLSEPKHFLTWEALFRPLTYQVWMTNAVVFVVISGLMYIYERKAHLMHESDGGAIHEKLENLCETILVPLGMLLEQPFPSTITKSVISVFWLFFCLVVGTSYKSKLVGFLTHPAKESVPRTFRELNDRPDYTVNIYYISGVDRGMWAHPKTAVMKGLSKRLHIQPDLESCLKSAMKPKTVCVGWKTVMKTAIYKYLDTGRNFNPLYITQEAAVTISAAMGLNRNSIFGDKFDKFAGNAVSGNLIWKWIEVFIQNVRRIHLLTEKSNATVKSADNEEETSSNAKPLQLENVFAIFLILFVGCTAGFIGYLGELTMYKCQE